MPKVLIIDDDRELVDFLGYWLRRGGFTTVGTSDGAEALSLFSSEQPDLVVLDVELGQHSGFEILPRIRQLSRVPVILLSGRSAEEDRVKGLDLGANDYVTKPFSHRELSARVTAQLRRRHRTWATASEPNQTVLTMGGLEVDMGKCTATKNGEPLGLTITEFKLLYRLMQNAGNVVTSASLLQHVWGFEDETETDVVRTTVHRLRRKLQEGEDGPFLQTVYGVGFTLKPTAESVAASA